MRTIIFFFALTIISISSFCQRNEIETVAEISSVTIYNSSAEIHYQQEVTLPQGKSTVIFTGLTPYIVDNTINVSASSQDADIISVTTKINYAKERKETDLTILHLQDSVTFLNQESGLLKCRYEAMNREKDLLFKDEPIGGVSKGVPVIEIEKASEFFSRRYLELVTEIFKLSTQEQALQDKLNKYKNQIRELTSDSLKAGSEIRVVVNNAAPGKVIFRFKFLTARGGWAPVYDCKYSGADKPLKFIFRANVFNASGVPWNDVEIKLSTANPMRGFDVPSLTSDHGPVTKTTDIDGIQFREIEVTNAIAEYDISYKYSIPADSKPYLVEVREYEMFAEYNYLLIPSLDPFGFLMAKIPDWNKYDLIPGTMNVYNMGSYMGKTFLNTYAENDTLNLYLGKDHVIHAVRKESASTNQNNFIGNYFVEKAEVSITVKNNTSEKYHIQILDQVPVYEDNEKVKFNLWNTNKALYNQNDGILSWNYDLDQNESAVFEYKYEARFPKTVVGNYHPPLRKARTISCPRFL